ncbi:hypothetical protein [uncultured Duncaniella sp.]|nr:hypothetical protein [uncultured Duncaniella sp.]
MLGNQNLLAMMEARLEKLQKGFASYEKIKRFTLLPHGFTMDNGELTNTLKIKRRVISEKYADQIEAMYS